MLKKLSFFLIFFFPLAVLAQQKLIVYTYRSFSADWGPGSAIKKSFELECNCILKYVALDDGISLLNRIRMEGKQSKADIVLGINNNLLEYAKKTNLFTTANIDASRINIPNGWHNETFIPYNYGWLAFIYDKTKLKNPPKSMKELIEDNRSFTIIYEDPRTSNLGLGLLLWMKKIYYYNNKQAWKKLAKKTVTVTKGWSEAYSLFLKHESDMVLSYTTSPAYHLIHEHKDTYAAANFTEGHYMHIEVAAIVKSSRNFALARKFMKFILTPAFQKAIVTGNWMYPVINTDLPPVYSTLVRPNTLLQFSSMEIASKRSKWINEWQSAVTP